MTAVFAATAVVVALWLARKQRERKTLSYAMEISELVSIRSEARDQIKIYYGGEHIEQAYLLDLSLENSGNVPIVTKDFERPLALCLKENGAPLTVDAPDTTPPELQPVVEVREHEVLLKPLLLNPGDGLKMKIIVRDFTGYQFDSRIAGVAHLTDAREQAKRFAKRRAFLQGILAGIVGGIIPMAIVLGRLLFD